ncbi:transmembrane protein 106B-like isoform X1 [Ptychodera flava]|uniref:transmembrane protein 106B-like isoform X1 n=1 Tax=Ptychodera flava TaxID=63121 RepID=UPI00396A593D
MTSINSKNYRTFNNVNGQKPSSPSDPAIVKMTRDDSGVISGSSASSDPEFRYEELHDGLTCLTCQGTGRIPRGQEDALVALIPYSDKRLKPRRTTLYVSIAIFTSLLAAGLLLFFLFPREVTVSLDRVETLAVSLNKSTGHESLWLNFKNTFNITNTNFVSATLNTITMQALYRNTIRGTSVSALGSAVLPRKSAQVSTELNVTFTGPDAVVVAIVCDPNRQISHNLYFKFQITLNSTFLSHSEESTITADLFAPCVIKKD